MLMESENLKKEVMKNSHNLIQKQGHENKIMQLEVRKLKYTLSQTVQNDNAIRNDLQTQIESIKLLEQQAQSTLIVERQAKDKLAMQSEFL